MSDSKRRSLPKSVRDMSKGELEEALKKKKECEAKALQIVETMLENPVNEEWFMESLKDIRQTHYEDIVEERAILKMCGYPLCHGMLKILPNHQYHISVRHNKVYDTTERKKYCSNQCYRAGKYLKDQLLTSPLWFSKYEEIPNFKLLPIGCAGMIGEEVDLGTGYRLNLVESNEECVFTSSNNFSSESHSEISLKNASKSDSKSSKNIPNKGASLYNINKDITETCESLAAGSDVLSNTSTISPEQFNPKDFATPEDNTFHKKSIKANLAPEDIISNSSEEITIAKTSNQQIHKDNKKLLAEDELTLSVVQSKLAVANLASANPECDTSHTRGRVVKDKVSKSPCKPQPGVNVSGTMSLVLHVETCLHEWFNLETMIFLFGEKRVREMIIEKGKSIKEYYKVISNTSWDPRLQERYESICKRLNLMEIEDSQYDQNAIKTVQELKPLPDYSVIQEEGKKLELKINAFYQGKITYVEDLNSEVVRKDNELIPDPLLPLIDTHAQKCYRRKIVQDRLNKVVPDLLRTFGLPSQDYNSEFRELIKTFSLQAHNIFFKPAEWNLLGLIIINMLSLKDTQLKARLETDKAKNYQTLMLIPYQQDSEYINKLISWLTNIDNLVDKPKEKE